MNAPADRLTPEALNEQQRRSEHEPHATLASKICIPSSLAAAKALDQLERAGYMAREYDGYIVLDRHQVLHFRSDIALLAFAAGVAVQRQRCSRRRVPYTKVIYEL
jgi:hypothetical protein